MTNLEKNSNVNSDKIKFRLLSSNDTNQQKLNSKYFRTDTYGNIISKKHKNHKINFADLIENSRELVEIKKVESFKEFNKYEYEGII